MVLKQFYLGCLAHASYLIADPDSGEAAVVDPQRDIAQYIADAHALGCRISRVFLTHFHADFVAGHLELRDRERAVIHLGARASAEYRFEAMRDGDVIELGSVRLVVLETPGHSPESISLLVYDREHSDSSPHAVLTGDTLFIGDVGRPDLRASLGWTAEELGGLLYDSLHEKLMALPNETLVYPTHGAGSLCGKNLSSDTVSTIGDQRSLNYALQPMSREQFIEIVTADQPEAPAYFEYDAALNAREHQTLEQSLEREITPLALDQLLALEEEGTQVLDTREPAQFESGHLRGAINVGLDGSYATWCGTVLDSERPIALISAPGTELEGAMRLGRIGFDSVAGFLAGGMQALADAPALVARIERVTPRLLAEQLRSSAPPLLIDVRNPPEWEEARIEGSVNIPLGQLQARLAELPEQRPIAVHCESGYRAAIAASLLRRAGFTEVSDLAGGFGAWQSSG